MGKARPLRRLTDRRSAASRPCTTMPRPTAARRVHPEPGGRRLEAGQAPTRRPVSCSALLGGSSPSLGAESRVANKDEPREEERRLEKIQDEARRVEGRRKRPLDANNHED